MKWFFKSELILAALIQIYDKKSFHFKNETLRELKYNWLQGATFYDCINTMYRFIKPFKDTSLIKSLL